MFIQQGKTNWILIIIVALIAGAIGGVLTIYINDTVRQTMELSRTVGLNNPEKTLATAENTDQTVSTETITQIPASLKTHSK